MSADHQADVRRALVLLQQGRIPECVALCNHVLATSADDPTCLMLIGLALHAQGKPDEALTFLVRADAAAPNHPMILGNLGVVLRATGRLDEAEAAYQAALVVQPDHMDARLNLARLYERQGQLQAAEDSFRLALSRVPDHADAMAGLASVLEQRHALDEAGLLAERSWSRTPSALAGLTRARIALRRNRPDDVIVIAETLKGHALSPVNRAILEGLVAQAHEKKGAYDRAFASFQSANTLLYRLHAPAYAQSAGVFDGTFLERWIEFQKEGRLARQPFAPDVHDHPGTHVFLIGFPRSGTTLMEQALAAHGQIVTLEEKDALADVFRALVAAPSIEGFFEGLTTETLSAFRAGYWEQVRTHLGSLPPGAMFIDKMPIYTAYLGLLRALFPNARFIFAVRDPRDVCLSCFQQRFGMNGVMFQFLTLPTTASLYDRTMRAGRTVRDQSPKAFHDVRYELLVGDLEGEMRKVLSFLGLPWSQDLLSYREKARGRVISTPSAAQVVEPLTTGAIGKWRHYAGPLETILPTLAPWVEHFGYSPDAHAV